MKWMLCAALILFSGLFSLEAAKSRDELRREFFKEAIPSSEKPKIEKPPYEVLSVSKGRVQGFYYLEGKGTRQIFCVEVKFKINEGPERQIPHLYVYLYDDQKRLVDRLTSLLYKEVTGSLEIDGSTYRFKPKRSHVIQFDYPPEIHFKYYLAVVGDKNNVSVQVEPGSADWRDFEFEGKEIYEQKMS